MILPFAILFAACGLSTGATTAVGTPDDASTDGATHGDGSAADADGFGDGSTGEAATGDARSDGGGSDAAGLDPQPVNIGSATDLTKAGSYILLAKTGITNATGSAIGGNLGVSPGVAASITGFVLVPDATTQFATSTSVVSPGRVYASNYGLPTPSNLTAAVLSMQAAYTDAASRSNPDYLNLGTGNIGGKTLAPGLYKWGTDVSIPADVVIAGGANDVWIFQITNDLDVSTAKTITLTGGAQAKNIFWQVAGQVTIHANAHFEGIILSQTGITLQTTASVHGRALAQSLVALDNNAVTAP